MARNPLNDITYYLSDTDILTFEPELFGTVRIVSIAPSAFDFNIELQGVWNSAILHNGLIGNLNISLEAADVYIRYPKSNWIKWSKIGEFDFTIDRTNLAGEMPIGWKGAIYKIGRLGEFIWVYGSGGITRLKAVDNVFSKVGTLDIYPRNKGAILVTENFHMIIDKQGCLWRFSDKIEKLGYEEFLNSLTNPSLYYDDINAIVYICDGIKGYVFSPSENSMGTGPINLTGIGYYEGSSYFLASGNVSSLDFQIGIDTIDLGNRGFKTIHEVELGLDSTCSFQLGIAFKNNISPTFIGPVWFNVTPEGRVFTNCWGKDHRIYLKTTSPDEFKLSYIKVKGQIADFNPLDA